MPGDWDRGDYQLHLEGPHLDDLEKLSGLDLPDTESYELDAHLGFDLDDYLKVDEFSASIGGSDLHGSLDWDIDAVRPAIKIRLASQRLDVDDMGLDESSPDRESPETEAPTLDEFLDSPLDPTFFSLVDLDIQVQVDQLTGLSEPVKDIALGLYANEKEIRLESSTATLMGADVKANATLPWGERIEALEPAGLSVRTLLKHTELDLRAKGSEARTLYSGKVMDRPLSISLSSLEASIQPGMPVTLQAEGMINQQAVSMSLRGESLTELAQSPIGPWQGLVFELRGDDIRLDASGSVERPLEAGGFDISYALSGGDLYALLPLRGAYTLSGRYRDQAGGHRVDDLKARLGASDINGRVAVHRVDAGPRVVARLESSRLRLDDLSPADPGQGSGKADLDQPLELGGLSKMGLDAEIRVRTLEGLDVDVQDVLLTARTRGQELSLESIRATVDGTQLDARAQLPWGQRLARLERQGLSLSRLMGHANLHLQARLPKGKIRHQTEMLDSNFAFDLTGLDASARPGDSLKITAKAELGDKPMDVNLQAEPLADLLKRPAGPWHDLEMGFQAGDIGFKASGSVQRPLEGSGFDIRFRLDGAEIDTLLPLFDLILPMEGPYSFAGRFADQPDRILIDDIEIRSGRSDIGGKMSAYLGGKRPKVVADLHSDQIYLRELLPVNETERSSEKRKHVIPDYDLPIERMRAHDAEVVFRSKRLRTEAGDLGDLKFRASLKDGVFRLAPFRVQSWDGALVKGDVTIDASQDIPSIDMELTADNVNHGLLLKQAGVAEIVEGLLDVTLRLSGDGRTRREFLGDADGQLIIVAEDGRIGSRRLDLWGSDLVTTMLSPSWHAANVTKLNCLVANVDIEDGVARSDSLLMDTQRITIAATGALNLESEELNFVFAPRPKRASLISLTNPVRVRGTMADPKVSVTVLPRSRTVAAGVGALAGLINPAYLIFTWSQTSWGDANPCLSAVEKARAMKGRPVEEPIIQKEEPPVEYAPLSGCSRVRR